MSVPDITFHALRNSGGRLAPATDGDDQAVVEMVTLIATCVVSFPSGAAVQDRRYTITVPNGLTCSRQSGLGWWSVGAFPERMVTPATPAATRQSNVQICMASW